MAHISAHTHTYYFAPGVKLRHRLNLQYSCWLTWLCFYRVPTLRWMDPQQLMFEFLGITTASQQQQHQQQLSAISLASCCKVTSWTFRKSGGLPFRGDAVRETRETVGDSVYVYVFHLNFRSSEVSQRVEEHRKNEGGVWVDETLLLFFSSHLRLAFKNENTKT